MTARELPRGVALLCALCLMACSIALGVVAGMVLW